MSLLVAAALATVFAVLALHLGWLTGSGALAAVLVGSVVFWRAGVAGAVLLAAFVVTSSLLTHRFAPALTPAPARARNARQVVANGGCAALGALLVPLAPETGWAVLTGGLAAAQADTWATEIGAASRRPPRLITTGRAVAKGTSGGVSALGTVGGIAGAALLAALVWLLGAPRSLALGSGVGGVIGMFADSMLGATLQGRFRCDACGFDTERARHDCGAEGRLTRGLRWVDNDLVNLAATACGAVATVAWIRLAEQSV